jgi:hypothetical protein
MSGTQFSPSLVGFQVIKQKGANWSELLCCACVSGLVRVSRQSAVHLSGGAILRTYDSFAVQGNPRVIVKCCMQFTVRHLGSMFRLSDGTEVLAGLSPQRLLLIATVARARNHWNGGSVRPPYVIRWMARNQGRLRPISAWRSTRSLRKGRLSHNRMGFHSLLQ